MSLVRSVTHALCLSGILAQKKNAVLLVKKTNWGALAPQLPRANGARARYPHPSPFWEPLKSYFESESMRFNRRAAAASSPCTAQFGWLHL